MARSELTGVGTEGPLPSTDEVLGEEVPRLAVRGVGILIIRTLVLQLFTVAGTVFLARTLTPNDYGAFALALAVQQMGRTFVEDGLTAALVRRDQPPDLHEQQVAFTFTLAVSGSISVIALVIAFGVVPALGVDSTLPGVAAVACLALPLFGTRLIPSLLLVRRVAYGRVSIIEAAETITFYGFALPAAVAGFGAYSLAGALPVSAAVGAAAASLIQPWKCRFRFDFGVLRPLLRFGAWAAGTTPVGLAREVVLIGILTATGGTALAGFYALALRLFLVPVTVFVAVQRAAFPSLSRTPPGEERARRAVKAVAVTAVGVGLPLAMIVGAATPLVAVVFGEKWLPTVDLVRAAAPGFLLVASVGAVMWSLRLANGDARTPFLANVGQGIITIALALALAGPFGTLGVGIAVGLGTAAFSFLVAGRTTRPARGAIAWALRALAVAALAAVAGAIVAHGTDAVALLAALTVSAVVWLGASVVASRGQLRLLCSLLVRFLRPRWA